jgi:hypothetical protein
VGVEALVGTEVLLDFVVEGAPGAELGGQVARRTFRWRVESRRV